MPHCDGRHATTDGTDGGGSAEELDALLAKLDAYRARGESVRRGDFRST